MALYPLALVCYTDRIETGFCATCGRLKTRFLAYMIEMIQMNTVRGKMRTAFKIVLGIAAASVLVIAGLGAGWLFWGRRLWAPGMMGGAGPSWSGTPGMMGGAGLSWNSASCDEGSSGWGMMGRGRGFGMMGEAGMMAEVQAGEYVPGLPDDRNGFISLPPAPSTSRTHKKPLKRTSRTWDTTTSRSPS